MKATIGKIYILRNPAFKDRLVKIGLTTRTTEIRASELSKPSGIPSDFEVLFEEDVLNVNQAENIVHQKLKKYRHNLKREFFDVPLKIAVKAVFEACQEVNKSFLGESRARLAIAIEGETLDKIRLETLKNTLGEYIGDEVDVFLLIVNKSVKATVSLPRNFSVMLSAELINRLISLNFVMEVILTPA